MKRFSKNFVRIGRYWYRIPDLLKVPVIAGGTSANTTQEDFWFRNDDGSLTTATYMGSQTSNQSIDADTVFRIRIIAEENNGKNDPWAFQLYAQKNGTGGYTAVTTSRTDGLQYVDDANSIADGTTISTADFDLTYTGTPTDGEYDDAQSSAGTGTIGLNGQYTEIEFCVWINTGTGNVSNGDYWDLRMYSTGGTPLDGYNAEPRVTAQNVLVTSGATLDASGDITADAKLDANAQTSLDATGDITAQPYAPVGLNQAHFRIRDDSAGLNVDSGWLAAIDQVPSTLDMGTPYRIRWEVEENAGTTENHAYKMQVRVNAGSWVDCGTQSNDTNTAVIMEESNQYTDTAATSDLLSGSSETFAAGEGVADDNLTAAVSLNNQHTEHEFSFFIMRRYNDFLELADAATVELRLVISDNTPLDNYLQTPSITVNYPSNFIGGTFVESPHNLLVVDTNDNLYYFSEHTSTVSPTANNVLIALKSTDRGVTWAEMDGTNRPTAADMESADIQFNDGTGEVHIFTTRGADADYHLFRTSDHSTNPDTWGVTDQSIITGGAETDQAIAGVVLSDGDAWAFYRQTDAGNESIKYKRRTSGSWGSENTLDSEASTDFTWVTCVVDDQNLTHIFYQETSNGSGNMYHRSLSSAGSLSGRESISSASGTDNNNSKGIAKPVFWQDGSDRIVMVVYRESSNSLYYRTVTNDGTPSSASQPTTTGINRAEGGSFMLSAQIIGNGSGEVYCVFSDITNENLHVVHYIDGTWGNEITVDSGADLYVDFQQINWYVNTWGNNGDLIGAIVYAPTWLGSSTPDDGVMWYTETTIKKQGRISLDGTGDLTLVGTVETGGAVNSGAQLDATGDLALTAQVLHEAQTSLDATGDLTLVGSYVKGSAQITEHSLIAGIPGKQHTFEAKLTYVMGATALDASGDLTLIAEVLHEAQTALDATGDLALTAQVLHEAQTALDATGDLTLTAQVLKEALTSLDASGDLILTAQVLHEALTALDATGDLALTAQILHGAQTVLDVSGDLTLTAQVLHEATTSLDASGDLSLTAQVVKSGTASLDASGDLSLTAQVLHEAITSLDASGNLTLVAQVLHEAQTQLDATGDLALTAQVAKFGAVSLDASGDLTLSAQVLHEASASLDALGDIVADAKLDALSGVQLDATGDLVMAGTLQGEVKGATLLDATGDITADAKLDAVSGTQLDATGNLVLVAEALHEATVSLDATGDLILTASITRGGFTSLDATGDLVAVGTVEGGEALFSGAQLDATGDLTLTAQTLHEALTSLDVTGDIVATAQVLHEALTSLDATGDLTALATLEGQVLGAASLDATGDLALTASMTFISGTSLDASGDLTLAAVMQYISATALDATGDLTLIGTKGLFGAVVLDATGDLILIGSRLVGGASILTASGQLTTTGRMLLGANASLDGSGDLTTDAVMQYTTGALLDASGVLTPTGTLFLAFYGLVGTTVGGRDTGLVVEDRELDTDVFSRDIDLTVEAK